LIPVDRGTWWGRAHGEDGFLVAYFSLEFAVHEALPFYAGGFGVLAGDHLKSASDLGVPMAGVGLCYAHGYFRQSIEDFEQRESYPDLDPTRLPLELEAPTVELELAGEAVVARIWRALAGSVPVYLLDTNVEGNSDRARGITNRLYAGDREQRLRQELLLGLGGIKALDALGLEPSVYHMNEGHSAFIALERLVQLVGEGLSFGEALELVRASTVFTTHTPVPAGNERFDFDLVQRYFEPIAERCNCPVELLLELGSAPGETQFVMTPFALRVADYANAVAALHGRVARRMWAALWPDRAEEEVPITHVTNAVHAPSWVSPEVETLLRKTGVVLEAGPEDQGWEHAAEVDAGALWWAHRARKAVLFEEHAPELDPDALTIGFARRFAAYKRAWLLFSQPERIARLLNDPTRPIQVLLAGKAHPDDREGKAVLREVLEFAARPEAGGRVLFLADYDIPIARELVQGVDVWLNTPLRPQEASGTSGMKAALNGVLNLSVLDGWWWEAFHDDVGWAIPEEVSDEGSEAEADELLRLLEEEIVPRFYDRAADGVPRGWVEMMLASITRLGERFNSGRMVAEYVERLYLPAHEGGRLRDRRGVTAG
jgi:starch phosphorylase